MALSRRLFLTSSTALAVTALLPVAAHRLPIVISTIEPIDGGRLGITHRLHAHDAVRVLALDPETSQPELTGLKARAKLALYVSKRFQISLTADEKKPAPINLEIIGAELEGDFLFVYQETDRPMPDQTWYLNSTILQDLDADWLSHVNYSFDKSVHTVTYSGKPRWRELKR